MKSIFLSREQIFDQPLKAIEVVGAAAPATDLALLTAPDDGFLFEPGGGMNYYLADGACVDRFGRQNPCAVCGIRPALLLEPGEEQLLDRVKTEGSVTLADYGLYPSTILDRSLRDLAEKNLAERALRDTGMSFTIGGKQYPVYRLGAKQMIVLTFDQSSANGYVQLSDGTIVSEGDKVFLELRPVRWIYDTENHLLIGCMVLFGGLSREETVSYLGGKFLRELTPAVEEDVPEGDGFRYVQHDELSLIRAYVDADIPVFIHGLSGDGKSDRVRQIDPQALDIELVNETPETINGRAVYNEAKDEIIDIKPAWLVRLDRLCKDGEPHILFFDELTNATKQTQSVIFKIVLERFVNNRWALPENARIVAAGNDRSESSASHDLAEPLFGRFAHVYIQTTVENWMPWAVREKINPFVMEFLANNDLYLRTPFTGTEGNADPRRWEMASRVLDASDNDFALLGPIVGRDTADAFVKFFRARQELTSLGHYSDEELARFSIARKYQLAQQCLYLSGTEEARELVRRLGPEYEAWFRYMVERKRSFGV
ncbi:MAG: ATP-binding protein [Oscillospiraceae bacterium]|nr:ATP-binding protein [Oscillospiraceae bacterium]